MVRFTKKEITDSSLWESTLKSTPNASFLQSWYWGLFHSHLGHKVVPLGLYHDNILKCVCLCIIEKARRATYMTIAAGPVMDFTNQALLSFWVGAISEIAKNNNCSFIRVRPQLPDQPKWRGLFTSLGFVPSPMHLSAQQTHELDITKTEDELMANMRKNTRYEIRKAQKENIQIKFSSNLEAANEFYKLQLQTAKRQNFVPFSKDYLIKQFQVFSEKNLALIYSAYFQNTLLAQAFVIFYGSEAVYHYGASTIAGRSHPGAYAIQWQAIRDAKERGLKRYNFWGVAPAGDNSHRFAALSTFKRGFGGTDVSYLPAHDLVINQTRYKLNYGIETVRKIIRRL